MKEQTFQLGRQWFSYYEPFIDNERRFELPLLKFFLNKFKGNLDLMEIGAVSSEYFITTHNIYDPLGKGSINAFAEDLKYSGKTVVSISTLEHIGRGDYGLSRNSYRVVSALNMMLEAENYLITWPLGYNTLLDYYVRNVVSGINARNIRIAHRVNQENNWKEDIPVFYDYQYNSPYPYGNAVVMLTNLPELL